MADKRNGTKIREKLEHLRKLLVTEDEFNITGNYFFEEIAGMPEFLNVGEAVEGNAVLEASIQKTMAELYSQLPIQEEDLPNKIMALLTIVHVERFDFYHGAMNFPDGIGTFFYFEEEKMGMVMVSFLRDDRSWFSRFTAMSIEGDGLPMYNHPKDVN